VHLFETFDCVYSQRSCHVTNLERVNLLQVQVAATLLDPCNKPDLNCIPHDQDYNNKEATVRANAAVVPGYADVRASAVMTDDNNDDVDDGKRTVRSDGQGSVTCKL